MNFNLLAAGANPLTHIVDHTWYDTGDGILLPTLLSNHIIMMILAALVLLAILPRFAGARKSGDEIEQMTPRGFRNAVEGLCQFLREFVGRPNLGKHTDRFMPYLWTAFFFILACNLLGLLPLEPISKGIIGKSIYGTATGNIFVTATLAVCTLLMIVVNGLRLNGMTYVGHFFMGPFPINILIAFLEVIGLVVKTVALAIRLFANMCAGHILLAVLLSFIMMAGATGSAMGFSVAIPVVIGSVAIGMLELFVAFLQAFIFTFLSAVFIGQAVNIHHDHGHDEEHGTEEAHAH